MHKNPEVFFTEQTGYDGDVGIITLDRASVLNSLSHDMILSMHGQLKIWEEAKHIKAVIIRAAEGRAFCAGGDLRLTYDRYLAGDTALASYFHDEYQLNRMIHHYKKPYIALLDGITMGGGAGISIHGSHRVATDRLMFAMPETGIGFFPDVGGTYFLPRLPGKLGYYLGLTGARINSDDCMALGITQHKVAADMLPALIEAIAQQAFDDNARQSVSRIIEQFKITANTSALLSQQRVLDLCFSESTVEKIVAALDSTTTTICKDAVQMIAKKSPISLKITLLALQHGAQLDFDACMRQEYRLTCRFLQHHDFFEGIRAIIIDKDQTPAWLPATLEAVKISEVEEYFAPLTEELTG